MLVEDRGHALGFLVELPRDVPLEDLLEDAGELADALVEERKQLVGLEVQVRLEVLDALVLKA